MIKRKWNPKKSATKTQFVVIGLVVTVILLFVPLFKGQSLANKVGRKLASKKTEEKPLTNSASKPINSDLVNLTREKLNRVTGGFKRLM